MSLGSNGMDWMRSLRKIPTRHRCTNLCINDPVRPDLHLSLCSNEMVQNTPIHEFEVQWGQSGAFVAKNSDATSLHEVVH
jgi:hypothetical protein